MMTNIIPTINLEDFPTEYEKLRRASEEWGCFRVLNHKIPLTFLSEMKRVVRSLLDLPMEIKKRNTDTTASSGYMAPSKVNPVYESLGLYDLGSPEAVSSFCSQLNASPHQRETIEKYAEAVHGLAIYIARRVAESMGLTGDLFQDWVCQFRTNKYNFTSATIKQDDTISTANCKGESVDDKFEKKKRGKKHKSKEEMDAVPDGVCITGLVTREKY